MDKIIVIDIHFIRPQVSAVYLLVEQGRAAFIDTGTTLTLPRLLEALRSAGVAQDAVDYVIPTHAHLDHAGGSAALLEACPKATLLAHPKAARHLINPVRLLRGAAAVHGEENLKTAYGPVPPVDAARVHTMSDEEEVAWHGRTLRFLHTLGHATHHLCIHDSGSNSVFTGDSFGVARTAYSRPGPTVIWCSSAPIDFDPVEARHTAKRLLATGAQCAYPAHFGPLTDVPAATAQLLDSIGALETILEAARASALEGEALIDFCEERVRDAVRAHFIRYGLDPNSEDYAWMTGDVRVNAMGLAYTAERRPA